MVGIVLGVVVLDALVGENDPDLADIRRDISAMEDRWRITVGHQLYLSGLLGLVCN